MEIKGDERGMLSKAGTEIGEKEPWVTDDKKGKNFKENGVVGINLWSTGQVFNGHSSREVPPGFCQYPCR